MIYIIIQIFYVIRKMDIADKNDMYICSGVIFLFNRDMR